MAQRPRGVVYPERVGGLDIYTAVIDDAVRTPDEFAAFINADYVRYGEIVKAVGVKIE